MVPKCLKIRATKAPATTNQKIISNNIPSWRAKDCSKPAKIAKATIAFSRERTPINCESAPLRLIIKKSEIKIIERAKGLLMEKEGLSERDAFSRIQRMSMDKRRSMKEIAEILITALEGRK